LPELIKIHRNRFDYCSYKNTFRGIISSLQNDKHVSFVALKKGLSWLDSLPFFEKGGDGRFDRHRHHFKVCLSVI